MFVKLNAMKKIIAQSVVIQRKFISRCSKVHQYEMALYNEKPQTCTSLVVRFDDEKNKTHLPDQIKHIKSKSSSTLGSYESSLIVLHANSGRINAPVVEERFDIVRTPPVTVLDILKWLAKAPDSGSKDPIPPGSRLGRLDAANEAGFFHRTNISRLKDIKKKLKDKIGTDPTAPKKTG